MDLLGSFIKKFTNEKISYVRIDRGFFFIPEELDALVNGQKPFAAGLFLGELKGKEFVPSAALLDWIAVRVDDRKKVVLNKKAAWLYLCGRDVFGEGIVSGRGRKDEFVLLQNELSETLGYGKVLKDVSVKNKVAVKNLFDKGYFLRKEKGKK